MPVRRIVSGGQTGVDRAALDVAIALGIPHGGWCPQGRRAEDGRISAQYQLQETPQRQYRVRTRLNVQQSDGTLILFLGQAGESPPAEQLTGGTLLTFQLAQRNQKPVLVFPLSGEDSSDRLSHIRQWLTEHQVENLNIAGPRESQSPGVYQSACDCLTRLFTDR